MSLLKAYSLDLKKEINAKDADIFYQKGLISSQKNFRCLNKSCGIAIICANLERPKYKRKVEPYFKSVENHKFGCSFAEEERRTKFQDIDKNGFYENVTSGEILVNLAEPTPKKQNSDNASEVKEISVSRTCQFSDSKKDKVSTNQTKTLSVLVSSFLNNENFPITLPKPYQERIFLRDAFIKVDGQDLSSLEQNCWRVYYGKAWINKLSSGDYQIKFDSQLHDISLLEVSSVRPSFFISKSLICDSPYEKFTKEKIDELIAQKKPKQVFIFSDVPSLNYTKKYINFMLEGLPYLEILDT